MKTLRECTIWASGFFMSKHLPIDYDQMPIKDMYIFINTYRWVPFKSMPVKDLAEHIFRLANEVHSVVGRKQ